MGSKARGAEGLAAVPAHQRDRIVTGMRWTFWLSALSAPFGYGTSALLARTGPEVIGTYGLLMVYITLISSIFYLGGDAVVVKYVPEIQPERRPAFLVSYLLVISLGLLPWLAIAAFWPHGLHYLFGAQGGVSFQFIVLCLSPIYIVFSLVAAALKGMLEMAWAQALVRIVTVGSFLLYAILFFFGHGLLETYYTELIWGIYLGLVALGAIVGFHQLRKSEGWRSSWRRLNFFVPPGFWRYVFSLEQSSALGFLMARLDFILVLNFAGLALLGKYVAIYAVAQGIQVVNKYFVDALLPSLTNVLATRNLNAASQIYSVNLRILFVANMMLTCALMFFIGPIVLLMGHAYVSITGLFVLMVLFFGLAAPGAVGSTALTSVGMQQRTVWVNLGQVALFIVLFLSLWPRWHLLGAILAQGISILISYIILLAVARFSVPFKFSAAKDYVIFLLVGGLAGAIALFLGPLPLPIAAVAWIIAVGAFLLLAGYRLGEAKMLVVFFLPAKRAQR
ncbi:MAG: hypothetical protein ACRD18_00795 [Terriglobia bacterium]